MTQDWFRSITTEKVTLSDQTRKRMIVNAFSSGITHYSRIFYHGITPDLLGQYFLTIRTMRPTTIMFLEFFGNGYLLVWETKFSKDSLQILHNVIKTAYLLKVRTTCCNCTDDFL